MELYTGSLRPLARKPPFNMTNNQQLKDRLVETIENAIGKPLLPDKPVTVETIDIAWHGLRPLDHKWEQKYCYHWVKPIGYYFPDDKLSQWSNDEIEECLEFLDSRELYVTAGSEVSPSVNHNPSYPPTKYIRLPLKTSRDAIFTILSRCLIATLSSFQKEQYSHTWPVQPMITGDGSEGFPGYRWRFSGSKAGFRGFPSTRPYLGFWDKEVRAMFIQSFEDGTLSLEKVENYNPEFPLLPKIILSKGFTYVYVDTHSTEHHDARLVPHQTPPNSVVSYGLNSLFGSKAEEFRPPPAVETKPDVFAARSENPPDLSSCDDFGSDQDTKCVSELIRHLYKQARRKEKEAEQKNEDYHALQQRFEEQHLNIIRLENELQTRNDRLDEQGYKLDKVRLQLQCCEEKCATMNKEQLSVSLELEGLKSKLAENEDGMNRLQNELNNANLERTDLEENHCKLKLELVTALPEIERLNSRVRDLITAKTLLTGQKTDLEEDVKNLKAQILKITSETGSPRPTSKNSVATSAPSVKSRGSPAELKTGLKPSSSYKPTKDGPTMTTTPKTGQATASKLNQQTSVKRPPEAADSKPSQIFKKFAQTSINTNRPEAVPQTPSFKKSASNPFQEWMKETMNEAGT